MIELRHLRYFIAVAEELNFTRAAERVHIDQTPLSRAVRELEDELGVQLFVRKPRRLVLTPAGARLLEEARKLFIRFERTKRAVRQTNAEVAANKAAVEKRVHSTLHRSGTGILEPCFEKHIGRKRWHCNVRQRAFERRRRQRHAVV